MHIPFDFVILRLNANIAGDFRIFPLFIYFLFYSLPACINLRSF